MATTMKLIDSYTVPSVQTTINFNNISNSYTDLMLLVSGRSTSATDVGNIVIAVTLNGSISSGFSAKRLYGGPTTGSDGTSGGGTTWGVQVAAGNTTANTFSNSKIYIPNYAGNTAKSAFMDGVGLSQTSSWETDLIAWYSSNTSPISSISLSPSGGQWVANSTFYLYGIKNS